MENMKTLVEQLKELQETETNKMTEYVISTIVERGDSAESFMMDVMQYGCKSGTVGELIYYHQTHKFFDTYSAEIFELAQEIYDETEFNVYTVALQNDDDMKNTLAWFAYEETVRKIAYEVELEY